MTIPYFNALPLDHRTKKYKFIVTGLAVRDRLGLPQNASVDEFAAVSNDIDFWERKADEAVQQHCFFDGVVYITNGDIRADECLSPA